MWRTLTIRDSHGKIYHLPALDSLPEGVARIVRDWRGNICYLSADTYQLINEKGISHSDPYKSGALVKMIGETPDHVGSHCDPTYCTVCRTDAEIAEFVGIKKGHLKKIEE